MIIFLIPFTFLLYFFPTVSIAKTFETQEWKTTNGARVIFYEAMDVPMLDISIAFAAGSAYEGKRFGLSTLTTRLLNQGNGGHNADTITEQLAATGAQYDASNNQDMIVLSLKTLSEPQALSQSIKTFATIINHPDFPPDVFQHEKNQQLLAITQAEESPADIADQLFFQVLYQKHAYAHPVLGTHASLTSLRLTDVHQFYQRFFVGNNTVIVLVGAITKPTAMALAETLVGHLPSGRVPSPIPKAAPLPEAIQVNVPFPSSQTTLRLGQLGIDHHDVAFFPLLVGNYILGGNPLNAELAEELREKRGLTYGVQSQFIPMPGNGPFLISLSTKSNQTKEALGIIHRTLSHFIQNGPTEAELTAAKQYLTGSYFLSLASNHSIATMLLKIAFYHLPHDYLRTYINNINLVHVEDIKHAFQSHLIEDKCLEIIVGST